ncbi:MAG: methenyltetrahydromethanopterin cyclohydrolase [Hyphomicrobiales bacterium]|nr:methenyltetrahydromethanopterin cyclohydrolase [Hyphomicrobiales bacterium]
MSDPVSVNARAARLVEALVADAAALRLAVARGTRGELLIDAGQAARGGVEAGLRIAEICLGGLGSVSLAPGESDGQWPFSLFVRSHDPVIACLGSQYAGWSLAHGDFFALGSGPGRALYAKEEIYADIGYRDHADAATLVLESASPPPAEIVDQVARDCQVKPQNLTFIYAPTQSLAGSTQVVARVLEVALHKAHELHFPLAHIVDGIASAPLAPPHPDFIQAMGRTNDAIIYGGRAHLFVTGPAAEARALAEKLPSSASKDFGKPFAEIFKSFDGDFYKIDPMLFSPALALVTALETGETFRAGALDAALLNKSFA